MIPDFKTFIGESIWADIYDRSTGETTRKEDSVDLLDPVDFFKYINDNYRTTYFNFRMLTDERSISVPMLKLANSCATCIKYNYYNGYVHMNIDFQKRYPDLYKNLTSNYSFNIEKMSDNYTRLYLSPLDGSKCSNSFFIKVIDFIIKNEDDKNLVCFKK